MLNMLPRDKVQMALAVYIFEIRLVPLLDHILCQPFKLKFQLQLQLCLQKKENRERIKQIVQGSPLMSIYVITLAGSTMMKNQNNQN